MSPHPLVGREPYCVRLQPGDVLLFSGHTPLSWAIKTKTWSECSHAEIYVGTVCEIPTLTREGWPSTTSVVVTAKRHSMTMKALRKIAGKPPLRSDGVNYYEFDPSGLILVGRPHHRWQRPAALQRFEQEMRGQGYDTFGLLAGFYARRHGCENTKAWCSETVDRVARWGGLHLFAEHVDADSIAPSDLRKSPELRMLDPWGEAERAA